MATRKKSPAEKAHDSTQPPKDARPADEAVPGPHGGAQHPESIIEPLADDEKAGPNSVQSREIRPDERGEDALGKTAFAAPAGETA